MPNVMAARPNIGGTLCESSVIPFFARRRKVWLTPARAVTLPIYENTRRGRKVNFARGKIQEARDPESVYILMYQARRRPNIVQSLVNFR